MSEDYSQSLLILKEWVRLYSDHMRNHDYQDARYDAMQAAKCAMSCMEAAKELDLAQYPVPADLTVAEE